MEPQRIRKKSTFEPAEKGLDSARFSARSTEVGIFESGFFSQPDIAVTAGLGPCLGIAVMNLETGNAALGHFPSPMWGNPQAFNEFLEKSINHCGQPQLLHVYLAGCGDEIDSEVAEFFGDRGSGMHSSPLRSSIIEHLCERGFALPRIYVAWGVGQEALDMAVDCRSRMVEVFSDAE